MSFSFKDNKSNFKAGFSKDLEEIKTDKNQKILLDEYIEETANEYEKEKPKNFKTEMTSQEIMNQIPNTPNIPKNVNMEFFMTRGKEKIENKKDEKDNKELKELREKNNKLQKEMEEIFKKNLELELKLTMMEDNINLYKEREEKLINEKNKIYDNISQFNIRLKELNEILLYKDIEIEKLLKLLEDEKKDEKKSFFKKK